MAMDWRGQQADLNLRTVRGALLLSGSGALENGRMRFSGRRRRPMDMKTRWATCSICWASAEW
jgi:hypothetical protein